MVSATLIHVLERARVRIGLDVEILDQRLKNLYPEGVTDLSRLIQDSASARRTLLDAIAVGRPDRLEGAGMHYHVYPLISSSRQRKPVGLLAVRATPPDNAESWSDVIRAIIESDLAAADLLGEERHRSRRLTGALRFLDFIIDSSDERAVTQALVQAAAIWYDVDARVFRRSLKGDFVLHAWLPGSTPGFQVLQPDILGTDGDLRRLESDWAIGQDGSGHEALVVPLRGVGVVDWVLLLIGRVPREADAVLRLIARVAQMQLVAIATRHSQSARGRFEMLVLQPTKTPERVAMQIVAELAQMMRAAGASLTLVRDTQAYRIAVVGSLETSAPAGPNETSDARRYTRELPLGSEHVAVLELSAASGNGFSPEDVAIADACATVLGPWLSGSLPLFGGPVPELPASPTPVFSSRIQEELERAHRFDLRLSLVLLEATASPAAIGQLEEALRRELRGSDVTGTMSARQLAAVLTHTDGLGLESVVRRLKQRLADAAERLNVSDLKLGQAASSPDVQSADALLNLALRQAEPLIVH